MTPKKKLSLLILGETGLFLLIVLFVVWPLLTSIRQEAEELAEERAKMAYLQADLQNLSLFQEKYQSSPELQAVQASFIKPRSPIAFITFLEEKAQENRLALEISILPSAQKEERLGRALRFLLKVEGSEPDFYNFLSRLEQGPYLIEVEALTIKSERGRFGTQEGEAALFDVSLTLRVYAQEE